MFAVDEFVDECLTTVRRGDGVAAVSELVERAVRDPSVPSILSADRSTFTVLHRSDELTVLHLVLPPSLASKRHDHTIWAAVGIVDGRENNAFYRRVEGALVPSGGREVNPGEVLSMGDKTIHAISNPLDRYLSAIHVYGGDLLAADRTEWDADGRGYRPTEHEVAANLNDRMRIHEDQLGRQLTAAEVQDLVHTARPS